MAIIARTAKIIIVKLLPIQSLRLVIIYSIIVGLILRVCLIIQWRRVRYLVILRQGMFHLVEHLLTWEHVVKHQFLELYH